MVTASLGSLADRIQQRVDDLPTTLSGTHLNAIIDEERLFMEEFTGLSIGSVSIAEKFQPALVDLSTAHVLELMQLQGGDFNSATLGPLSISKGTSGNLTTASSAFRASGMMKLKQLGSTIGFKRTL